MPTAELKRCSRCKERKPADSKHFHLHTVRERTKLSSWCRQCKSEHAKRMRAIVTPNVAAIERVSDIRLEGNMVVKTLPPSIGFSFSI